MQTRFSPEQLATPRIADANAILRKCVHCGFCLPACPTYQLTGDENDSPRGRIYLLKEMFESGAAPDRLTIHHIDRCLGCLGCMPACPSGVDYMHLADLGRQQIAESGRRRLVDRMVRFAVTRIVSNEELFRPILAFGRAMARIVPALPGRLDAALRSARGAPRIPPRTSLPARTGAIGTARMRVLLMPGCAQQVLYPEVNEAAIRLLARHGAEVIVAPARGCCGALTYHMGEIEPARDHARRNLAAWSDAKREGTIDAVVILASGCGLLLKDYGSFFAPDSPETEAAKAFATSVRDISEVLTDLPLEPVGYGPRPVIAYQAPCSLEHGQRVRSQPRDLLRKAGFELREIAESNLCCGSAGAYSLLQPEMSKRLKDRKVAAIRASGAGVVATANIGCQIHLADAAQVPVLHLVQLLDWATGGPVPSQIEGRSAAE